MEFVIATATDVWRIAYGYVPPTTSSPPLKEQFFEIAMTAYGAQRVRQCETIPRNALAAMVAPS